MTKYPRISELKILQSAAGFYIGTLYMYSDDEYVPHSRLSQYFTNEHDAYDALINKTYIEKLD